MSDAVGTAFVDIRAKWDDGQATREIGSGVDRSVGGQNQSRTRAAGAVIGRNLVAGFATVWAGGQALGIAQDLISDSQVIAAGITMAEQSFGDATARVREFGDQFNESFGVSEDRMLALLGGTGDLLVGLGATADQAADLSTEGARLAGILSLASGGALSMEDATERLNAAMVGETDGLKAMGIAISAADIETRLLAQGQSELTGEARRAAEAQAVLDIAYEQSAGKVQSYEEGLFGAMERQNELSAAVDTAKVKAGELLNEGWLALVEFITEEVMPAWEELRPTVEEVMARIQEVTQSVLAFVEEVWAIFGDEILATVRAVFGSMLDRIQTFFSIVQGVFDLVTSLLRGEWGNAWDAFSGIVTDAVGFIWREIQRIFDLVVAYLGGLPGAIAGIGASMWNGLWDGFKSIINRIIRGWNSLRFTIPRMEIDPPGPLPSIGAGPWTFGVPTIPELAQGGLITEATLALIGEDSRTTPEIVSPEALMRRIVREEAGTGLSTAPMVQVFIGDDQLEPRLVRVVDGRMGDLARAVTAGVR